MKTILAALVCCATASLATAGTHVGIGFSIGVPPPVIVRRAPPPRIVERVVVAPGAGYLWIPGHYTWTASQWVWVAGAWVVPPRPDARWVDGNWNPQTQQWVDAHWEIPAAPPPTTVVIPSTPAPAIGTYAEVIVAEPPPPPREEIRVIAPGAGYVWISGYWGWENGRREWFRGHWERPPHGYRVWIAPRWEHRPNGYAFVHGYWQ